jgi:hypothetical protein
MRRDRVKRDQAPVCLCNDCGVDCLALGEYYMLNPDIWGKQLGLGWGDNLCIGCLEKRLGRRITVTDFVGGCFTTSPWGESRRLKARRLGFAVSKRRPYRKLKSARWLSLSPKDVAEIGKYRDAEPPL